VRTLRILHWLALYVFLVHVGLFVPLWIAFAGFYVLFNDNGQMERPTTIVMHLLGPTGGLSFAVWLLLAFMLWQLRRDLARARKTNKPPLRKILTQPWDAPG